MMVDECQNTMPVGRALLVADEPHDFPATEDAAVNVVRGAETETCVAVHARIENDDRDTLRDRGFNLAFDGSLI